MRIEYQQDPQAAAKNRPAHRFLLPPLADRQHDTVRAYLDLIATIEAWCLENIGRQDGKKCPNWQFKGPVFPSTRTAFQIRDDVQATAFRIRWC